MYHHRRTSMFRVVLVSLALTATGQEVGNDDWIDPYDMINYDSSTKTMRKPVEPATYPNVPTKRREHTPDSSKPAENTSGEKIVELQQQIEELNEKIKTLSQQPTCTPVFKRFLRRLLKEIQRVGLPTDSSVGLYDAKIEMSRQSMAEIQTLLEGEESWRTGALDNAISQILVDLKPHDCEVWKWRFEETFGIELDTALKLGLGVLLIVAIVNTQLWSQVAWCVQLSRLFAVCFLVSIVWNWFYMYKIAFADRQKNMVKLEGIGDKCTGLKKYDWYDNLKELYRSTLTLEDDPCKKYYELVFVNPLLLVPPTEAISVTIVTFITKPLKHVGEGISEFIQALLKDLPVTWQIIVFATMVFLIMVFMYVSVHGAFRYGITAPFHHPRLDPPPPPPPPPPPTQPQHRLQGREDQDQLPQRVLPRVQGHLAAGGTKNQVRQRRTNKDVASMELVETLRTAEHHRHEDADAQLGDEEQSLSNESDSEERLQPPAELAGAGANANTAWNEDAATNSDTHHLQAFQVIVNKKQLKKEAGNLKRAPKPPAEEQPSQTGTQEPTQAKPEELSHGEAVSVPVQETVPFTAS